MFFPSAGLLWRTEALTWSVHKDVYINNTYGTYGLICILYHFHLISIWSSPFISLYVSLMIYLYKTLFSTFIIIPFLTIFCMTNPGFQFQEIPTQIPPINSQLLHLKEAKTFSWYFFLPSWGADFVNQFLRLTLSWYYIETVNICEGMWIQWGIPFVSPVLSLLS